MNEKDNEIMMEAIEKPLNKLMESLPKKHDFWFMKLILNNPQKLVEQIFVHYFDLIESGGCERDKASFVARKLFECAKEEKVISLQYTYAESKTPEKWGKDDLNRMCYWCPCTFKDTDEAFTGLMKMINPAALPTFLKKQKEIYEPYRLEKIEEAKEYYLNNLKSLKPVERDITVEELINEHLKEYPNVQLSVHILDPKTGLLKYFYDPIVGWQILDNHNLRGKKVLTINDSNHWKNIPEETRNKYKWITSHISITIKEESNQ